VIVVFVFPVSVFKNRLTADVVIDKGVLSVVVE
jgi:hypothetical protein